ncbi:MAG: CoA synthetase [Rhodospirillaceae bacterium]|jgi:glutaconate CoA-transferase, subunit B|nr:CoA synthetase [Rhodospirillaceae bacterium]
MSYKTEELMITVIARLLDDPAVRHVAVGAASPIPGSAALLVRHLTEGRLRASIIHGVANNPFTDGGREIFDCAGQGRIDVFFLGGVQIDGEANVNLVGTGEYPTVDKRFPGSFGSAYMYFVVPKVILFRPEHTRRVFVPKVDFISAPGTSEPDVYRPGGPKALVTELCLMSFDPARKRFTLESVHPGHTLEEVRDNTGFDFDIPDIVPVTPEPEPDRLGLLRSQIGEQIAEIYPDFVARVFESKQEDAA